MVYTKEWPKKKTTTVHACPGDGISRMSCCHRTPFEVPMEDQLSLNPDLVTCGKKGQRRASSAAK